MKKKYLIPVLFLLSACGQEEWPGDQVQYATDVITFSSPYSTDTRTALRDGSFMQGDKVGVLGYCKSENDGVDYSSSDWDTKKPFCIPDIFYNQELRYDGTGSWTYNWNESGNIDGLHPWLANEDYTYSFFAYYPYAGIKNSDGSLTISTDEVDDMGTIRLSGETVFGDPTITYTMPHQGAHTNSGLDWREVPDFMLAYETDHLKRYGSVKLEFRHLFGAFEFRVNNYNLYPVTISDMYVSGGVEGGADGFYKSVSVTGQESGYTVGEDVYIGQFKLLGGATSEGFICPGATIEGEQVIPSTQEVLSGDKEKIVLLFIPDENGKLTSDGNKSVTLTLKAASETGTIDEENRSMVLENSAFQPGVRSVFNINIVGNDFYIQVRSDGAWDDGGDSDIVFE